MRYMTFSLVFSLRNVKSTLLKDFSYYQLLQGELGAAQTTNKPEFTAAAGNWDHFCVSWVH